MPDPATLEFPMTEEGLQEALSVLADARKSGDVATEGWVLLKLCTLVKWVRSDTCEPPFERAETLAAEALGVFRRIGDERGIAKALIQPVLFADAETVNRRFQEAEGIAKKLDDTPLLADVLAAQARTMGLRDKDRARELALEALALYRALDRPRGVASCLSSLALGPGDSKGKRVYAVEAFECYRRAGDPKEAHRALMLAFLNSETDEDLIGLEPYVHLAMADAQAADDRSGLEQGYESLAKIAAAKGDPEAADAFRRQAVEFKEPDNLSPEERREMDRYFTQLMIEAARQSGDDEARRSFEERLAELDGEEGRDGPK